MHQVGLGRDPGMKQCIAVWSALRRAPSLTVAVYGFVLLSAFVASAIMLFGIRSETRQYEHAVQSSALNRPPLGWLLAARLPGQTPEVARAELTAGMITLLAGLFAEVMLATYAFIRTFIRPVRQLAADAKAISEGDAAVHGASLVA